MKLWPPCSEMMEFLISSYCIVQLTSVKFFALIKDGNRDILIFFPPWEFQYKHSHGHLEVKMNYYDILVCSSAVSASNLKYVFSIRNPNSNRVVTDKPPVLINLYLETYISFENKVIKRPVRDAYLFSPKFDSSLPPPQDYGLP